MSNVHELDSGLYRRREAALRPPQPDEQLVKELSERVLATVGVVELADVGREFADENEKARLTAGSVAGIWEEAAYAPRPVDLFEGLVRMAVADETRTELAVWLYARVKTDQGGVHGAMSHRYRLLNEVTKRKEVARAKKSVKVVP